VSLCITLRQARTQNLRSSELIVGLTCRPTGDGGELVTVQAAPRQGAALFHFGNICQYDRPHEPEYTLQFFHYRWERTIITFEIFDVLKKCPAEVYWPFCVLCGKFVWALHRAGREHVRKSQLALQMMYSEAACRQLRQERLAWILSQVDADKYMLDQ